MRGVCACIVVWGAGGARVRVRLESELMVPSGAGGWWAGVAVGVDDVGNGVVDDVC